MSGYPSAPNKNFINNNSTQRPLQQNLQSPRRYLNPSVAIQLSKIHSDNIQRPFVNHNQRGRIPRMPSEHNMPYFNYRMNTNSPNNRASLYSLHQMRRPLSQRGIPNQLNNSYAPTQTFQPKIKMSPSASSESLFLETQNNNHRMIASSYQRPRRPLDNQTYLRPLRSFNHFDFLKRNDANFDGIVNKERPIQGLEGIGLDSYSPFANKRPGVFNDTERYLDWNLENKRKEISKELTTSPSQEKTSDDWLKYNRFNMEIDISPPKSFMKIPSIKSEKYNKKSLTDELKLMDLEILKPQKNKKKPNKKNTKIEVTPIQKKPETKIATFKPGSVIPTQSDEADPEPKERKIEKLKQIINAKANVKKRKRSKAQVDYTLSEISPLSFSFKRKKRDEKFSSLSIDDLLLKKKSVSKKLEELQKTPGKTVPFVHSDFSLKNSNWNKILNESKTYHSDFKNRMPNNERRMKKLCKEIKNYKSEVKKKGKRITVKKQNKKIKKAKEIAKLVRIGFWKKINKLSELKSAWHRDEQRRALFKEKLDTFVRQSQDLAKKVAENLSVQNQGLLKKQDQQDENSKTKIKGVKTPIPVLLRFGTLRDYQRIGLDWLVTMHESNLNGILADEMGLGKTIQTIALLAHLACSEENWGPHLLVVPTSVLVNWATEFKKWLPGFKVVAYYGSVKQRKDLRKGWDSSNSFHVLVTSYNTVVTDVKVFRRRQWEYIVLDEAHHIKNFRSRKWQTLLNFNSKHRLLLSGTPLQNNVMELWAFLHFLMPKLFESRIEFTEWFDCPMSDLLKRNSVLANSQTVRSLHAIMRPFMLRRLKTEVAEQLPQKHERLVLCPLSPRQRKLYEDFMKESNTKEVMRRENLVGLWGILMQLRKVCNHPDLFEGREIYAPFVMNGPEAKCEPVLRAGRVMSKFPFDGICLELCRIFRENEKTWSEDERQNLRVSEADLKSLFSGKETFETEEPIIKTLIANPIWGTQHLLSEQTRERSPKTYQYQYGARNKTQNIIFGEDLLKLLFFRNAFIEGKKRKSLSLKRTVKSVKNRSDEFKGILEKFMLVNPLVRANLPDSLFELQERYLVNSSSSFNRLRTEKPIGNLDLSEQVESRFPAENGTKNSEKRALMEPFNRSFTFSSLTVPDKKTLQWDCGKLQILSSLLAEQKRKGNRCLIFTQMTKMLDIFEAFLNIYGYRYFRLDGSTRTDRRGAMMERFNNDESVFVFILSTRSGGYGINLTGANVVIFYDTDWNPAIDMQAQDRAHRIGQTREVTIYRMISENTVEMNMYRVAENKRKMNSAVIGDGKFNTENLFRKSEIFQMLGIEKNPEEDEKEENSNKMMEMMNAVEDVEDQKNLRSAMDEIRQEGAVSAKEQSEQLEAELNEVELYALNYHESWVSISNFDTAADNFGGGHNGDKDIDKDPFEEVTVKTETPGQNSRTQKRRLFRRKTENYEKEKRMKSEGVEREDLSEVSPAAKRLRTDEETGKDAAPLPLKALLKKKFASLQKEDRVRVLDHYTRFFEQMGCFVHKVLVKRDSPSFPLNALEYDCRSSAVFEKNRENSPVVVKNIKKEPNTDINVVKNESEADWKIVFENERFDFCDENLTRKKLISETKNEIVSSLFPVIKNPKKIWNEPKNLETLLDDFKGRRRNRFGYVWGNCPSLPKISFAVSAPKETAGVEQKPNAVLQRRRSSNKKRTSRRSFRKTNMNNPKIFVREVVVRIPFVYLLKRFPQGWKSILSRRKEIQSQEAEGYIFKIDSEKEVNKRNKDNFYTSKKLKSGYFPKTPTKNIEENPGISTPKMWYKLPLMWKEDEDRELLMLHQKSPGNYSFLAFSLSRNKKFKGIVRSAVECRLRIDFLKAIDKTKNQGISADAHCSRAFATKTFESRQKTVDLAFKKRNRHAAPNLCSNVQIHTMSTLNSPSSLATLRKTLLMSRKNRSLIKAALSEKLTRKTETSSGQQKFFELMKTKISEWDLLTNPLLMWKWWEQVKVKRKNSFETLKRQEISKHMVEFSRYILQNTSTGMTAGSSENFNQFVMTFVRLYPEHRNEIQSVLNCKISRLNRLVALSKLYLSIVNVPVEV